MASEERLKVFLDSNIWFSALYTNFKGSYPSVILKLSQAGIFDLYYTTLVALELRHNVQKKIPEKESALNTMLERAKKLIDVLLDLEILKRLPEGDRVILSTAIYNRVDAFVTGNTRDFGYLLGERIGKTWILSPRDFCEKRYL